MILTSPPLVDTCPEDRSLRSAAVAKPASRQTVSSNGKVANVFSLPSTNRTLQLKGDDARVLPFDPDDLPLVDAHVSDFLLEVIPLGLPEDVVRMLFSYTVDDLVTVIYSPCAAFSQTPGPKAGAPLKGSA